MKTNGSTLLEFLIYISIVVVISTVAGAIGLNVIFGKVKLTAVKEVSQSARLATEKIALSVRNAESIISPATSTTASILSLRMADSTKNPTVIDLFNDVIRIKEGVSQTVNLTSRQVKVTGLLFSNFSYPKTPGTIKVQATIKFVNPSNRQEYNFERTFFTTANIRKK